MLHPKTKGFILEFEAKTFRSKDVRWNELGRVLHRTDASLQLDKISWYKIIRLAETALEEYETKRAGSELILHACLTQALVLLSRLTVEGQALHSTFELFETFMQLVEKHYTEEHRVEFYAKALKLTPKALTMRFYRENMHPPRDLIQDRCVLEAKRLLAYSETSVAEIADMLGFEDANYFSRFFRVKSKLTPGQFREASRRSC
ncbi:MAG: AraC family transcriptional regulator [Proteobacteria bacterium]|nr:MAG: AraC family transcriptional regulator [Pseudomonadota bacterium]